MMSESKNSSTAVDLSGLVQKPSTAPQKELLATVAGRLGQASVSSLIRHAIELSQIEKGWKNATGVKENKPNPENVTDAQAIRIVKAFGGEPSTKEIVDSKMQKRVKLMLITTKHVLVSMKLSMQPPHQQRQSQLTITSRVK